MRRKQPVILVAPALALLVGVLMSSGAIARALTNAEQSVLDQRDQSYGGGVAAQRLLFRLGVEADVAPVS